MEHCTYLRKFPDKPYKKSHIPFSRDCTDAYFADHLNHYGHKSSSVWIDSTGYDSNWPARNDITNRVIDRLVMYYVIDGQGYFNDAPVSAGDFFYALPCECHSIRQNPENPIRGYWLTVRGNHIESFITRVGLLDTPHIIRLSCIEKIAEIIDDMVYNTHGDCDISAYMTSALYLIIAYQKRETMKNGLNKPSPENNYIKKALYYIEKNYTQNFTVSDIAAELHISSKRLSNIFSKNVGSTVKELTAKYRIDLSCTLLIQDRSCTTADIASIVGYDDYAYFSRVFRKIKGVSPTDYRKRKSTPASAVKNTETKV